MTSSSWYVALILAVGVERLAELRLSVRHAAWAFTRGGVESGRGHYPFMVVLHTGLLVGCVAEVLIADRPFLPWLGWPMLVLVVAAQALRWWCISALGVRWNTRVIVVPGLPLGHERSVPVPAPPELRRGCDRGICAAARPYRVGHRAGVHGPERRPADGADSYRERRVGLGAYVTAYDTDVLVAGGGPVGLVAALEARRRGFDVTVVEPRTVPVDKACGEGLMPSALRRLERLGVDPRGYTFEGITYVAAERRVTARFNDGHGRGVRRTALHAALSARADDVGVHRHAGRVDGVTQGEVWVRAASLRARWLIAADGLHSPIRRDLGLDRPTSSPKRWGLRRHFSVEPWSDTVEVHWSEAVEAYVTPVGPREVGIAVLTSTPGVGHDAWLEAFPALRERVAGAARGEVRGAGPLAQRSSARVSGRVLLVGDAAGYVDALTGEGMAVGWAAADAAAHCLALGRPQDYEAAWQSVVRRSWWLTVGLLAATRRRRIRSGLVPAADALPGVFARLVRQLA